MVYHHEIHNAVDRTSEYLHTLDERQLNIKNHLPV